MGYPTSVFSPVARSNGQTIDASHTNDLQTEVTAMQTGLLGTITHSVNVSGASTLATLQAAASTFSVRPVTPPPDVVRVYLESTVTVGSSAASTLAWTQQDIVTNSSIHSTATNPERLTPQSTGVYQCVLQVAFAAATTGALAAAAIRDSSGGIFGFNRQIASSGAAHVQVVGYKRFDVVGSHVTVSIHPGGFSTLSISSGSEQTWFAMHKL